MSACRHKQVIVDRGDGVGWLSESRKSLLFPSFGWLNRNHPWSLFIFLSISGAVSGTLKQQKLSDNLISFVLRKLVTQHVPLINLKTKENLCFCIKGRSHIMSATDGGSHPISDLFYLISDFFRKGLEGSLQFFYFFWQRVAKSKYICRIGKQVFSEYDTFS